jgi:hypothetical protein
MARPRRRQAHLHSEPPTGTASIACAGCNQQILDPVTWWLSNGRPCHADINCWNLAKELPHVQVRL